MVHRCSIFPNPKLKPPSLNPPILNTQSHHNYPNIKNVPFFIYFAICAIIIAYAIFTVLFLPNTSKS